jgi:hypothetical protein
MATNPQKPCKACQLIRRFLLLAAGLLGVLYLQPDWRLPPGFDYGKLVGDLFALVFVLLLGWKIYQYRRDLKSGAEKDRIRRRIEEQLALRRHGRRR